MTLKEIALRADVSISTVSRIINSPDGSFARKEIRDRVWAIVQDTGYTPNQSARALKQGVAQKSQNCPSGAIACILGRTRNFDDNPFFAQLARAIEQQAMELGYPIRMSYSVLDLHSVSVPQDVASFRTDGAIVIGQLDHGAVSTLQTQYKNLVYVGRNTISFQCDQVICDGYEATRAAVNHLIMLGHRRIGYIGETSNEIRYQAYLDTLRSHDLESSPFLSGSCSQNGIGGYNAASQFIGSGRPLPTAIFCATDITAIAVLRRFAEAKIKVPEQVSIISMDNIEASGYVSPMLTTIGMPILEMGNMAVQTLIGRIQKKHKLPLKILLPHNLIVRESVANLNAGAYI